MPISRIPGVGLDTGSSGVAPSNLSTGGPSWSGSGYLTSQINNAVAGQYAPMYLFRLNSDLVGANVTTAQNVFGVGITLSAGTVYAFEAFYGLSKSAGAASHNLGFGFGGTATVNNILYEALGSFILSSTLSGTLTTDITYRIGSVANSTANINVYPNASGASLSWAYIIRGTISISAGGTFIPQYTLSAAPGGAYSTVAGSYFLIYPVSASGANTNIGGWA